MSDDVREQVREVLELRLLGPMGEELRRRGVADPELCAELVAAVALGIAISRANGTLGRLAAAPREQVLELLAPLLQALGGADSA